ncbi:hypothetical protein Nizo2535_0007 [Lactiplantibacillus plantarum]|nr:hypothetical protein Nizo2535_0007 [Lactiplantibacillus plantarum]KZU79309.1 hypothetical protein Nizo2891_1060 [Lactiplantibacillus plantarum]
MGAGTDLTGLTLIDSVPIESLERKMLFRKSLSNAEASLYWFDGGFYAMIN